MNFKLNEGQNHVPECNTGLSGKEVSEELAMFPNLRELHTSWGRGSALIKLCKRIM